MRKHNGNATRSMQTISAILVVRCSDTIPAQNWLNTRFDKVGMVRVTRSVVAIGAVKAVRDEMGWEYIKKDIAGNNQKESKKTPQINLSPLSKFIICFSRIAEFDPAQPRIAN